MSSRGAVTRRNFLHAVGIGGATVWIPSRVAGYTGAEVAARAVGGRLEVGISKWDLDTPALLVDLDKLERNIDTMRTSLTRTGIASRPHAKTHKCPAIARLQLAGGAVGICTAKVSEAEVMFEHGIDRILMTTVNATPAKIQRAMNIRRWCEGFVQAVDNAENARQLSEAAQAAKVVADVAIDVAPSGMTRTGIQGGRPALELAQLVDTLPGLRLRGLLCYDGGSQHVTGFDKRRAQTLERMGAGAETCQLMKQSGLDTGIFSGGGTGTYNIDHETPGLTDVQVGSYVFMDTQYLAIGDADGHEVYDDFEPSLTVLTTVLNANFEGGVTTDGGAKAFTISEPDPIVLGETGMTYRARSDEFGVLRYENPSRTYRLGDKLELIVAHCDPVVNLYDQLYGVRGDRVEVVWPIAARGKSQ